jgi:hypothetical protein
MKHIRKLRNASAERIKQPAQPATPISDEVAAFYDSRRLTEEDIDHMAEVYSEARIFNRKLRASHE